MTVLICPVRPGDRNEELRFALRSWETNLLTPDGLMLVVVGHCPPWLKPDEFIEGNRYTSAPLSVFDNVMLASDHVASGYHSSIKALYMNDDFFCLDPMESVLPVRRNCTLAEHIASAGNPSSWWGVSLRLTASWLSERGFPHPDSYEVHRPLPASPSEMWETLALWEGGMEGPLPQWRTMYGTLAGVKGYPVKDGKLSTGNTGIGTPWISTSDQTWRRYAPSIMKRFQKPSRWEIS